MGECCTSEAPTCLDADDVGAEAERFGEVVELVREPEPDLRAVELGLQEGGLKVHLLDLATLPARPHEEGAKRLDPRHRVRDGSVLPKNITKR